MSDVYSSRTEAEQTSGCDRCEAIEMNGDPSQHQHRVGCKKLFITVEERIDNLFLPINEEQGFSDLRCKFNKLLEIAKESQAVITQVQDETIFLTGREKLKDLSEKINKVLLEEI